MEELKIRPYARLLSMLGDQLIKNETVALTELVKNAYDADASTCNVQFNEFNESSENKVGSSIVIEDDGYGMSYEIITKHFLNPATPIKKSTDLQRKSKKGRICQGEKGIGRFSMLKLGRKVTIISKEENLDIIHKVTFDFTKYDDEFLTELEKQKEIFLDEIKIDYAECKAGSYESNLLINKKHGTSIIVDSLKGKWSPAKIKDFIDGMIRFSPFELDDQKIVKNKDFNISILVNRKKLDYQSEELNKIKDIVFHKSLYKIKGNYSEKDKKITFSAEEANVKLDDNAIFLDPDAAINHHPTQHFQKLRIYSDKKSTKDKHKQIISFFENGKTTECGDFSFSFYIFDFVATQHEPFGLTPKEKDIIREHRVFLYRDGIRVQPYGAPDDDWLQIDRNRMERASLQFSNDQLFGQINITKKNNVNLKDKTSREGIQEGTDAFQQLILLIRGFLSYIRTTHYQNYVFSKDKKERSKEAEKKVEKEFSELEELLKNDKFGLEKLKGLQNVFSEQKAVYTRRIDIAEQLAGVGMSVEMASHDIMLTLSRLRDNIYQTAVEANSDMLCDLNKIRSNSEQAESMIGLIYMKMKNIQQLFVSSKQRPKLISVIDIVKKIETIYKRAYDDKRIKVEYETIGSPVRARVIDAVLFQVFINLFDNALYWMQEIDKNRVVKIKFDGFSQTVTVADNGIGVRVEDAPHVFEAFYTGKGEEGRGLGLYIARKLLNRHGYEIDLISNEREKMLKGANFLVSFVTKEGDSGE